MGAYNELNGRWQRSMRTREQTSAAAGPSHAAGPSSGTRDELANRAFPSEILLVFLKKSKTNVNVLQSIPNCARTAVAYTLEQLMRDIFNTIRPARERA